jgi:DNA-binding response OmpR family regulator
MNLTKQEADTLHSLFPNGGETYTREELAHELYKHVAADIQHANQLIDKYLSDGWITEASEDVFVR